MADKFVLLLMAGFVLGRRLVYLPTQNGPYMVRFGMWERQAIVIASCKRIKKFELKLSSFKKISDIMLANEFIIRMGGGSQPVEHLAAHWAISKDLYRYLNLNGLDIVIGRLFFLLDRPIGNTCPFLLRPFYEGRMRVIKHFDCAVISNHTDRLY